ncbi:unnamed protein product [Ceratitis capitata]|uniref:(Mediterranean fruit fly) hypothetical protein n=1 Tax=Ceratitis capitata TaxID=7213 RepID=A0A811TZU5_CERCA|nr:unnamed protein product [Ceratitis capitata]
MGKCLEKNAEPLSDSAISFNNVSPNQMYVFEIFIYHLRPYGINNTLESLPERLKVGQNITTASSTVACN